MSHEGTIHDLVADAPRYLFFTGKGGVGKTSLSCSIALALSAQEKRVLLISTDPASNLSEVLGATLGSTPIAVPLTHGLYALNIDPDEAAQAYREKVMAPYRDRLPAAMVAGIEEQLSGACTTEIAAFNEFSRFLGDPEAAEGYDHVVFDTAPTGHTLRLLQLPSAWHQFIDTNTSGTSCLGPLSGLADQKGLYERTLKTLADESSTQLVLVSRPEVTALAEAERSRSELQALGLRNLKLVLNGVFDDVSDDELATAMAGRQQQAIESMPAELARLPFCKVTLKPCNVHGVEALAAMLSDDAMTSPADVPGYEPVPITGEDLKRMIDDIAQAGHGVIMTMGKGGVGKTTIAAAIALELASRGHAVHLSTTDPAAHLEQALEGAVEGLEVSRIDPKVEVEAYTQEVMASAGAGLDEDDRRLLEEDLRSPCTEEIAVFRAFARQVDRAQRQFVVLDTAPTGHTLLLLDATESYHREVLRNRSQMPDEVRHLLPRLRDPDYTRIFIVTLPEFTPVHEATSLQEDLRRAQIEPHAWLVNQSLAPLSVSHPVLQARRRNEIPHLEAVARISTRFAVVPWLIREPTGVEGLRQITKSLEEASQTR